MLDKLSVAFLIRLSILNEVSSLYVLYIGRT